MPMDLKENITIEGEQETEGKNTETNARYFDLGEAPSSLQHENTPSPAKGTSAEFTIGTVLLSIVGGSFILSAMVLFGIHFMGGFAKGMCLYAGTLVLLLVSELLIYRKWPKLGIVFTSISIGGLYFSTLINYMTLENFNMWVAVGIVLFIAIAMILLSRKRDSFVYRAIGLITFYFCLLLLAESGALQEIIVVTVTALLINVMCICMPLQSKRTGFNILHMYAGGIYAILLDCGGTGMEFAGLLVAGSTVLILQILLVVQVRYQRKALAAGLHVGVRGIAVAYFLNGILVLLSLSGGVIWHALGIEPWVRHGFVACIAVVTLAAMLTLRKGQEMWYPYFYANATAFLFYCMSENDFEKAICMAVLLGIAKLLSFCKIPVLKGSDAVLTTLCCIMCLGSLLNTEELEVVFVLCVLISILFIRYWQTYFESILTFTLAFFTIAKLPTILRLEVFVGILFVGILLFHNVERWRGKYIRVYNYIVLAAQAVCFLLLLNPIYRNTYIVYLCMLVFGLATIILTFREKYRMNFKCKNLILSIFLSYMAFVIRTNYPIINSILLMVIALCCVGFGFAGKEKTVRIYGLVLSLIICGKIALYDFFGASALQKVILFLVAGIIALAIAAIYMVLEKKMRRAL